jgi:hypothetical protein
VFLAISPDPITPRGRVLAALAHRTLDRVPRFEIWIDALLGEMGLTDSQHAAVHFRQDCVLLPTETPAGSCAWQTGVDEWGRVWKDGMYADGVVHSRDDLKRYSPPLTDVDQFFDPARIERVRQRWPDHCLIYGTHIGPLTAAYMAMGLERFFAGCLLDRRLVEEVLDTRTDWCIQMYRRAVELGAEVLVIGEDAAHRQGPMIAPSMWRSLILPLHRRIVQALDRPVIWHSDGNLVPLLPMAIEAGFVGVHGLEPAAGVDLARVKREFGNDLVLVGNVDVRVLCGSDLAAVEREVRRCYHDGGRGGYMIATCNSIFHGMRADAVRAFFELESTVADEHGGDRSGGLSHPKG